MLHTANYQGNVKQNRKETSPHTCRNGYHQKEQMINVGEDTEKALLVKTCVLSNAGIRKTPVRSYVSSVQSLHHVLLFVTPWTQHSRLPCPSPSPGACSNSRPSSRWCHPTISSSVVPFFSCLQSLPSSGSFPMSQFFASGGQRSYVSSFKLSKQQIYNERDLGRKMLRLWGHKYYVQWGLMRTESTKSKRLTAHSVTNTVHKERSLWWAKYNVKQSK